MGGLGEWLERLGALAFALVLAATIVVEAIGRFTRGKYGTKLFERLSKLHDMLSPFALRNQEKLHQPMPVDEQNPYKAPGG